MRKYEITFRAACREGVSKPITVLVIEPDRLSENTGAVLFTHGLGVNRFILQDCMEYTCDQMDLVCISVEFRGCGYDFDPVTGLGHTWPYDMSFYQTIDVLNGLRTVLEMRPMINRKRIFHYARSQGGHIALLSSIYAPNTFAFVCAGSPITHVSEDIKTWCGRDFSERELSARNVLEHADMIRCPIFLDHGTSDGTVPHIPHTVALVEKLESLGSKPTVIYYEGCDHDLSPIMPWIEVFKRTADEPMRTLTNPRTDDFAAGSVVEISCAGSILRIDWSEPSDSSKLIVWKHHG